MESFATPYPLVFHDGEQEQHKGFIGIHSRLTFKRFQALLSQKTGIPSNQLSTVFVCRKPLKGSEQTQRLPINGNTNFSILLNQHNPNKERDCYFLVFLRRSKKERKGSRKRGAESEAHDGWEMSSPSGLEERGHLSNHIAEEEMASMGSVLATEADCHPHLTSTTSSKKSRDSGLPSETNQTHNDLERVILKRGSTPFSWKHKELQAEKFVPFNSPRFAALREEDKRDINWRWEDSFPRPEQWELQPPAIAHNASDFGGHPQYSPNHQHISLIPTKGQVVNGRHRKGEPMQAYHHNLYRNGSSEDGFGHGLYSDGKFFLSPKHSIPKFRAHHQTSCYSASSPSLREGNPYMQQPTHMNFSSEGLWQRMPGALSEIPYEHVGIDLRFHDEITMPHQFCQVCFECNRRNVSPIPFHWCVKDAVVQGRSRGPSPAGPIGRRAKMQHLEATAA